ncbi:NEAT domain-containing protein [Paenibacillus sp. HB172176]|uniref:NEAT domain-containing protein n=1 Tax=Paenibacillus sp. HB172176 TaxID=2493690 RepID=UPI00143C1E6D|nr:NEAT domain-containing protein [Paenibacillus sp. HB172176]
MTLTATINRFFSILIAFALLFANLYMGEVSAEAETSTVVPDGEYSIPFRYVKDGTSETSAANAFMTANTGKLIIADGHAVFEHEIKKSDFSTFAYFGSRNPGSVKAVITEAGSVESVTGIEGYTEASVRDAEDPDHVIIQLPIEDVWTKQDILMHIHDEDNIYGLPILYNHWYNAQLELSLSGIDLTPPGEEEEEDNSADTEVTLEQFQERLTVGHSVYASTSEGTGDGFYPEGSRTTLYNQLLLAESIVNDSPDNPSILSAAYTLLDQAIKSYEAKLIVVDKSRLSQWITVAEQWLLTAKDGGETESGGPAKPSEAAISHGEYPVDTSTRPISGLTQKVRASINDAQSIVDDASASQTVVNEMYDQIHSAYDWVDIAKQQFVASNVDILILDSIGPDAQISEYADEISPTAVILQKKSAPYYEAYANITFIDDPNDDLEFGPQTIQQVSINATTGSFGNYTSNRAVPVTLSTTDTNKVYQTYIRSGNQNHLQTDMLWQGLWKLKYPAELPAPVEPVREIYISFNKAYLDELNALVTEAQNVYDQAVIGSEAGQYTMESKALLQAAIASASETGNWLAAPRPQILTATTELQEAIDAFEYSAGQPFYFTIAHATNDAFSTMENYFVRPAIMNQETDGSYHITFILKDSSTVPEFKTKVNDEYLEAETLSEDTSSDQRRVSFTVNDLSALLDAKVRTVVPSQNYDRTHDIRLNLNNVDNSALYALIKEAGSFLQGAEEGSATGQYPVGSKAALQEALAAASQEAVHTDAAEEDSNSALQALQSAFDAFKDAVIEGDSGTPGNGTPGVLNPVYPANGSYYIPFQVLKDGTNSVSIMDGYLFGSALVQVTGNTKTVSFTLKQSAEIVALTLNGSSGSVSNSNPDANTRVVTYALSSLSSKIPAWVDVNWPAINYVHNYNIQFLFDESSAVYAGSSPSVPGGNGQVGAPPGYELGDGTGTVNPGDNVAGEETEEEAEEETNEESPELPGDLPSFSDIVNHWAKIDIEKAIKRGIVTGYSDGTFHPDNIVTRGEFAVMISRALNLEGEGRAAFSDNSQIPDWAKDYIARAVAIGLMSGFEDQTFRAAGQLTRAQLAVIIARAANLSHSSTSTSGFDDQGDIPAWAQQEVAAAAQAGLIQGKENNRFGPSDTATRAEALTLIIRLLAYMEKLNAS